MYGVSEIDSILLDYSGLVIQIRGMGWNSFEEIELWQEARKISSEIWLITRKHNTQIDRRTVSQMLSASGSMMDNIAEGFGRGSNAEFKTFLGYSKGSSNELLSQLTRLFDHDILSADKFSELRERLIVFSKRSTALIKSLKQDDRSGFRVDKQNYY